MSPKIRKFVRAAAGVALLSASVAAQAVDVPICIPNITCLQFGDFNVYSLPILNNLAGYGATPKPGDPYFYSSTYGAIQNYTIMGINNGNSTTTGNPPASVDGSYNTPSPNNDTSVTFSTFTATDPNGGPAAGDKKSWDAAISSLPTPLAAFFAFNETGKGTGLETTDLLIWARASVYNYDAQGNVVGDPLQFYLSGDGSKTVPNVNALPAANSTSFGPWVYVHAGVCLDANQNFVGFPGTNGQCGVGQTYAKQNDLGQNAAAFMVNSPALDAALKSGLYNVLSIDWEMAYINGGGETAWIQPVTSSQIPEPGMLALVGIGLIALASRRRK